MKEAAATVGSVPEIFNTDQGGQFTSNDRPHAVDGLGIQVSMDGGGRWMDHVFIGRLWRSPKCERLDQSSHHHLIELKARLYGWMHDQNHHRIHQAQSLSVLRSTGCPGRSRVCSHGVPEIQLSSGHKRYKAERAVSETAVICKGWIPWMRALLAIDMDGFHIEWPGDSDFFGTMLISRNLVRSETIPDGRCLGIVRPIKTV